MMERITRKVETPEMDSQPLEMMSPFILNSLAHFNNLIKKITLVVSSSSIHPLLLVGRDFLTIVLFSDSSMTL